MMMGKSRMGVMRMEMDVQLVSWGHKCLLRNLPLQGKKGGTPATVEHRVKRSLCCQDWWSQHIFRDEREEFTGGEIMERKSSLRKWERRWDTKGQRPEGEEYLSQHHPRSLRGTELHALQGFSSYSCPANGCSCTQSKFGNIGGLKMYTFFL